MTAQNNSSDSRDNPPGQKDLADVRPTEGGFPGEEAHGGSEGEASYGYGRQGGSVAGTGTRTDVPVGIEQVESSKAYKVSPKEALERQGDPFPRTSTRERGVAGSTEDDTNDQ